MSNLIAEELEIKEIIIPPYSGNFSAWGLLGADLLQMNAKTKILRLSDDALTECNTILENLFKELEERQKMHSRRSRSRGKALNAGNSLAGLKPLIVKQTSS